MHSNQSTDEITKQNKRSPMRKAIFKVAGGTNPAWVFHNSNLTLEGKNVHDTSALT